jgi:hypothetical protein
LAEAAQRQVNVDAILDGWLEGWIKDRTEALARALESDPVGACQRFDTGIAFGNQARALAAASLKKETTPMATFKMGRKRPAPYRKLMFSNYAKPTLPPPPAFVHRGAKALPCLSNIYGNDTLGDCTAAGAGHGMGIWRGNAGNNDPAPTLEQVIAFYSATTGYVPGNPATDQGGDEVTVLNAWRDKGFFADGTGKIAAWCNVDATNPVEVRQAIWLAEFVYFGVELPPKWVSPMPQTSGFVWDVAGDADPNNGHCFIAGSYDAGPNKIIIDTWGEFGYITDAAIAKYASSPGGELHAAFSMDCINRASQKSDSGFAFEQLLADSAAL